MNRQYYSRKKVAREQEKMRRRGTRKGILGRETRFPIGNRAIRTLVYNERNSFPGYVVVEVHGGGFMYNTAFDDDDFCAFIHKRLQIPVVACDYRLAPRHKFPAGLEDVHDCVKAVMDAGLAADPRKVILWGHSAGANLVAGASRLAKERGSFSPAMQILDYPYMDAFRNSKERQPIPFSVPGKLMDTFAFYYAAQNELSNPLISPALTPSSQLRGMPETFLLLCGMDNLNAGGRAYGALLREAGVRVTVYEAEKALHGFIENHFNFPQVPLATKLQMTGTQRRLAQEAVDHICDWILARVKNEA